MIDKVQETNEFSFSPESADLSTATTTSVPQSQATTEIATATHLPFADTMTDMITCSEGLDWVVPPPFGLFLNESLICYQKTLIGHL